MPEALRAAGLDIRVHDELFPQATQDVVWLTEAGAQRWVVITRDDRIRYNQLEKQAVLAAKLRFFSITSSSRATARRSRSPRSPKATVLTTKGKSYRMRKRRTREEPS